MFLPVAEHATFTCFNPVEKANTEVSIDVTVLGIYKSVREFNPKNALSFNVEILLGNDK